MHISGSRVFRNLSPEPEAWTTKGPCAFSTGAFSTGHAATQEQMKFSSFSKTSQETSPWHQASRAAECFRLGPRGGQLRRAGTEQGLGLEDTLPRTSIFLNYILGQKPQTEKPQGKSHQGWGRNQKTKADFIRKTWPFKTGLRESWNFLD